MSIARNIRDVASGELLLTIAIRPAEIDGGFIAECIELPGCMAQGETEAEVKANIGDAIEAVLSVMLEDCILAGGAEIPAKLQGIAMQEKVSVKIAPTCP